MGVDGCLKGGGVRRVDGGSISPNTTTTPSSLKMSQAPKTPKRPQPHSKPQPRTDLLFKVVEDVEVGEKFKDLLAVVLLACYLTVEQVQVPEVWKLFLRVVVQSHDGAVEDGGGKMFGVVVVGKCLGWWWWEDVWGSGG